MRSRLGLNSPRFNPPGFENRPVSPVETGFNPRAVGFENRPAGVESWVPKPQNTGVIDYAPKPNIEQWAPHPQSASPVDNAQGTLNQGVGGRQFGSAMNPYMW